LLLNPNVVDDDDVDDDIDDDDDHDDDDGDDNGDDGDGGNYCTFSFLRDLDAIYETSQYLTNK